MAPVGRGGKKKPAAASAEKGEAKRKAAAEKESGEEPKKRRKKQPEKDTEEKINEEEPKGETVGTKAVADIREISAETAKLLEARGITSLFEIQTKAFSPCYSGKDVVGRAKTGCGKTLAFVLPTVERIKAGDFIPKGKRTPLVVAVAPTRELARQIFTDFESIGAAGGLTAKCFYGGTAFGPQCEDLRRGTDILVCTPGRLLDHIRRETVDLSKCAVLVLDEADEMLSMGFQEDVESILQALPKENLQKLLFSATLPSWVNALVEKHLHDPAWIDVTNQDDSNATNSKIKHKCINCPGTMRADCIGDLCKVHAGAFGKTLVFTATKKECDELVANDKLSAIGAAALHGDIGQNTRDSVIDGFRAGRVKCLIATDIAARGIDVPCVDLVIQTRPCPDLEKYVHRAGRTARGGREGTCVTFYSKNEEYMIRMLEKRKGIKMQRIGPPQPSDIVAAATSDAVTMLDHVHQDSVDAFMERAKELIAERGAEVSLAAALATMTGHARRLQGRSLLSSFEGCTAVQLTSDREMETNSKGWYLLRQNLPSDIQEACKGLCLCEDGYSAIFDVPDDMLPRLLQTKLWRGIKMEVPAELPPLRSQTDMWEAQKQLQERQARQRQFYSQSKDRGSSWGPSWDSGEGGRGGGARGRGGGGRGRGGSVGPGRGRGSPY